MPFWDGRSKPEPQSTYREVGHGESQPLLAERSERAAKWLLEGADEEVLDALTELAEKRPYLLRRASVGGSIPRLRAASENPNKGPTLSTAPSSPVPEYARELQGSVPPLLQFSTVQYFVSEGDPKVQLDVMRVGNLENRSEVHYRTRDVSAKAGTTYEATWGRLIFAPGDQVKPILVKLFADDDWAPALDFVVDLEETGLVNGRLEYGRTGQVKVLDRDLFPSSLYQEEIRSGTIEEVSPYWLLFEYFKMNFSQKAIRTATIKQVILDVVRNIFMVSRLFLQVILLDIVLDVHDDETEDSEQLRTRHQWLLALVLVPVLIHTFMHFADYRAVSWRIGGMSRLTLQSALMRTFLYHSETAAETLREGDLTLAITHNAPDLVANGYLNCIVIVQRLGSLVGYLIFQFLAPVVFHKPVRWPGILVSFAYPVAVWCLMDCRRRMMARLLKKETVTQSNLFDNVDQASASFNIVAGYNRELYFVDRMESDIRCYNDAAVKRIQATVNNTYMCNWFTAIGVALWVWYGGRLVIADTMELGMFVTRLQIISQIGETWAGIYHIILSMEMTLPGLHRIIALMNMSTNLHERETVSARCTKDTIANFEALAESVGKRGNPDSLRIKIQRIVIDDVHETLIRQGTLVAVVGRGGSGKVSLLRAIGGVSFDWSLDGQLVKPGSTVVTVPSHLRVVHVDANPIFFHGSLFANLTFGLLEEEMGEKEQSDLARKVCERLGFDKSWVRNVLEDEKQIQEGDVSPQLKNWSEILDPDELQLISLARGLIANPAVLVIHTPTAVLDSKRGTNVISVLKEFVSNRGVTLDPDSKWLRNARTCIFSAATTIGVAAADNVLVLDETGLIRQANSKEVTDDMLGSTGARTQEILKRSCFSARLEPVGTGDLEVESVVE